MAGSRLELIGTVFSRMHGLLRTGAIKYEDRPIWFDIYRVFPPKLEPQFAREPVLPKGVPTEIPELMYKEDIPRAAFYKKFGPNAGVSARNLADESTEDSAPVRFVEKYNSIQKLNPDWSVDQVLELAFKDFHVGFSPRSTEDVMHSTGAQSVSASPQNKDSDSTADPSTSARKRGTKRAIVTADTLLSMFKEAKSKSDHKKNESG